MADHQLNPYAAPRSIEPQVRDAPSDELARLGTPSVALLVLAALWGIAWLHAFFVHIVHGGPSRRWADLILLLVFLSASAFIAFGAMMMRRGKCYRLSMAAAIIACIPALSPCIYLGIPFAIWAVIALRRADVKAAFQRDYASAASNPT